MLDVRRECGVGEVRSLSLCGFVSAGAVRQHDSDIYRAMYRLFDSFDALALPVAGNMPRAQSEEWVRDVNGTMFSNYMDWLRFSFLATVTGLPAISVPVGLSDDGIPVGQQLIGPPRGEAQLLAVAQAVEAAVGGPLSPIDPVVHSRRELPSKQNQERRGGETLAQA